MCQQGAPEKVRARRSLTLLELDRHEWDTEVNLTTVDFRNLDGNQLAILSVVVWRIEVGGRDNGLGSGNRDDERTEDRDNGKHLEESRGLHGEVDLRL